MLSQKVPDSLITYDFPSREGRSFLVRTDRRKKIHIEYTGKVSANISQPDSSLQILVDNKPVKFYDGKNEPWELQINHNGERHSSFASSYFKQLPENETLYLKHYAERVLDTNLITTQEVEEEPDYSCLEISFFDKHIYLTVENTVINTFENLIEKEHGEEISKWEKLLIKTIGHSYPFLLEESQYAKEAMIHKTKNSTKEYKNFTVNQDDSGEGYTITRF